MDAKNINGDKEGEVRNFDSKNTEELISSIKELDSVFKKASDALLKKLADENDKPFTSPKA